MQTVTKSLCGVTSLKQHERINSVRGLQEPGHCLHPLATAVKCSDNGEYGQQVSEARKTKRESSTAMIAEETNSLPPQSNLAEEERNAYKIEIDNAKLQLEQMRVALNQYEREKTDMQVAVGTKPQKVQISEG